MSTKTPPTIALKFKAGRAKVEAIQYAGITQAGMNFHLPDLGNPQWLNDAYLADGVSSLERAMSRGVVPAETVSELLDMPANIRVQMGWAFGTTLAPGDWLVRKDNSVTVVAPGDFSQTYEALE